MAALFKQSREALIATGSLAPDRPDGLTLARSAANIQRLELDSPSAHIGLKPAVPQVSSEDARRLASGTIVGVVGSDGSVTTGIVQGDTITEIVEDVTTIGELTLSEPAADTNPLNNQPPPPPVEEEAAPTPEAAPETLQPVAPPVETVQTPTSPTGEIYYTSDVAGTITVRAADGTIIGWLDAATGEPL